MRLYLRDNSYPMVEAWDRQFKDDDDVTISQGNIFAPETEGLDALVSPANSFGFMDGGIDGVYSNYLGWHVQQRVQEAIRTGYEGDLFVGQALIVGTENEKYPRLICAPTMRVPEDISNTLNAYYAFAAVLRVARDYMGARIDSILCPGLGTFTGNLSYDRCAIQMRVAWEVVQKGQTWEPDDLRIAMIRHQLLLNPER